MNNKRKIVNLLVGVLIAIFFIFLVLRGIDFIEVKRYILAANWMLIIISSLFVPLSMLNRAYRWKNILNVIKKDIKIKNDMLQMLAKKIAVLNPSELKDFFESALPVKIEQSGLRELVINILPQEKIKEILQEITVWYEEIKKTVKSEFEAAEHLASLRRFLNKILKITDVLFILLNVVNNWIMAVSLKIKEGILLRRSE